MSTKKFPVEWVKLEKKDGVVRPGWFGQNHLSKLQVIERLDRKFYWEVEVFGLLARWGEADTEQDGKAAAQRAYEDMT